LGHTIRSPTLGSAFALVGRLYPLALPLLSLRWLLCSLGPRSDSVAGLGGTVAGRHAFVGVLGRLARRRGYRSRACSLPLDVFRFPTSMSAPPLVPVWGKTHSSLSVLPRFGRLGPVSPGSVVTSSLLASIARLKASASSYPASRLFIVERRFDAWLAEEARPLRPSFFSLRGDRAPSLLRERDREAALDGRLSGR
jgi:hypothetical protein